MAGNQQTRTESEFHSEDSDSDVRAPEADAEEPEPDSDSEPSQDDANPARRFRSKKAILEALDAIVYATCVSLWRSKIREEMKNNITIDVYNTISRLPSVQRCSRAQVEQLSELRLVAMAEEVLVNLRFLCEVSSRAEEVEPAGEVEPILDPLRRLNL